MILKLYSLSDNYCNYLRKYDYKVYKNKEEFRKHTRKYLGVVMIINNYNYYIPLSSPKKTDYIDKKCTKIKKSTNTIIRIKARDRFNNEILRGTLRISNMIPIPIKELEYYDKNKEKDLKYKDVIEDEINFIRKHENQIIKKAKLVYRQKELKYNINYLDNCIDYKMMEEKCQEYTYKKL